MKPCRLTFSWWKDFPFWSNFFFFFLEHLYILRYNSLTMKFAHLKYIIQRFVVYLQICANTTTILGYFHHFKKKLQGLPWWRSGWESACQCRGHGFEPWSGKIPHATEQLGLWATIAEPARLEPVLRNKRGRDSERPAHRDEEWPPLAAARESPRTETKTQHSHE